MRSLPYLIVAASLIILSVALGLFVWGERSKKQGLENTRPASLSLSPTGQEINFIKGKTYTLNINVDSKGKGVDGVDVVINYDPNKVEVIGKEVKVTNILERTILNKVDNTKGQITLSALTFDPKTISGTLGSFEIRPKNRGEVTFSFDFSAGATTDSNIAEHSTKNDILGKVDNATFIFK